MPPVRKVDKLPTELKHWLHEALKARGFGDFIALTEDLNFKLEEEGLELRIGKSAIHAYSQEYEQFSKFQDEASNWAADWMNDNGLEDEAKRHNILFQMITTSAFKILKSQMLKDGGEIDPKELHFLGKMMKDVMASSGIREQIMETERARIAKETRETAAAGIEKKGAQLGLTKKTIADIKAEILGVAA